MTESNAIAVDPDDAAILGVGKPGEDVVGVDSEGPAHQIRGRGAQARDRQERLTNVAREPVAIRCRTNSAKVGGSAPDFRLSAGPRANSMA